MIEGNHASYRIVLMGQVIAIDPTSPMGPIIATDPKSPWDH